MVTSGTKNKGPVGPSHSGPVGPIYEKFVLFHEWGPSVRWGAAGTVKIHIMSMRVVFPESFCEGSSLLVGAGVFARFLESRRHD